MLIRDFIVTRNVAILVPNVTHLWLVGAGTWVGSALAMYTLLRLAFKWRYPKTWQQEKRDVLLFLYLNIVYAMMGGIATRLTGAFRGANLDGILFIPIYLAYVALYTGLFAACTSERFVMTDTTLASRPVAMVLIATMVALVLASLLFYAWYAGIFEGYIAFVVALLIVHLVFLVDPHVHLHHWFFPIPFIVLCVFDTYGCFMIQVAALAMHTHGLALFGVQDIFIKS